MKSTVFLILATVLATGPSAVLADVEFSAEAVQALLDSGDPEDAVEILDRRLRKRPSDPEALFLRSTAFLMSGDFAAGRRDLERSIELDPERRQAWLNRAALDVAEMKYTPALEAFMQAERLDPTATDNSLNIGAVLLLDGQREAAAGRFRRYLEANSENADAYFLVAANYAMTERKDLAVQLLERAIALDETARLRARTDANFAALADDPTYQQLLATDSYRLPAGALVASKRYDLRYTGRDSRVLEAALTALQLAAAPISRGIEVTPRWALIWSDVRIKVAAVGDTGTEVTVTAPPSAYSEQAWTAKTDELFRQIALQLHTRRAPKVPAP